MNFNTKNIIGLIIVVIAFAANFGIPYIYKKRGGTRGDIMTKIKLACLAVAVIGMLIVFIK